MSPGAGSQRARRGAAVFLVVALAVVAFPTADAAAAQGSSRATELERIRFEIERLERRLSRVTAQRGDQRQRLERLTLEVELQEEKVAEVRAERRLVEERLAELGVTIAALETSLEESRRRLQRGLGTLYRLGGGGAWRSLLTAGSARGSLESRRALRYLSWRQAQRVEEYRRGRDELETQRAERLAQRDRVAELEASESTRLARLDTLRSQQARVVAALEREAAELEQRAGELLERQSRLADLLSFLAGQRPDSAGDEPIQRFKGVLDWPLEGEVLQGFGPRLDPRYRTRVPHNGISLGASEGAEVRSIFPGVVVFAEDFEGFGITVVVHHAERVFTLYSGLASARVVAQDVISSGQVLGRAAERLYFEVRVEDRPEDPLEWLR